MFLVTPLHGVIAPAVLTRATGGQDVD